MGMNNLKQTLVGFVLGIALVSILGWTQMPDMMLQEIESPYNVNETVEKIKANALSSGWVVASVKSLDQAVKKHGGYDIAPVKLINLCQADHAYNILKEEKNKKISVMMPCTISVYQKADGKAYIGIMNAGLLGKMFGGSVAEIMGHEVAAQQQQFISFALKS
jgi:uncharacterized protein (DUF302 family)